MKFVLPFLLLSFFLSDLNAQLFSEKSQEIGFDHNFRHRNLLGGGAAFFDFDNDGDDDFYVTGGANRDELYVNNGDGTFSKKTEEFGIHSTANYNTMGVCTGDIDNDGDREIFVTTWERFAGSEQPIARSLLFLNNGNGTFTEIGEDAGITKVGFGLGAAFLDYNKDGFLDVYVMNHIRKASFTQDSTGAVNGFDHECYPNFLYRNNGDNTFTNVAVEFGVDSYGCTIAAAPTDYDMDGDLDLFLANDFGYWLTSNEMFENNFPADSFSDVSAATGANIEAFGMGIASGDYDHDLDFDYYTTNIGRNILVENDNGSFIDVTTFAGVENAVVEGEGNTTGWGTAFFDVDNDTWDDLYVANGRIPTLADYATATNDPDKLYLNNGDKTFTDITDEAGVGDISYCHGMAYSDYDQDGDLDIIVVVIDEFDYKSKFYVNEIENDNNYIQFKLIGTESNRDAYGSKIWLFAEDQTFVKELYGGGASHASQHTSVMHFGLGQIESVDSIRIDWTNGRVDHLGSFDINQLHTIEESEPTSSLDQLGSLNPLQIRVTPNPFENLIKLQSQENINSELKIELISITGLIMHSESIWHNNFSQIQIDNALPPGFYTLYVQSEKGRMVKKMIKR